MSRRKRALITRKREGEKECLGTCYLYLPLSSSSSHVSREELFIIVLPPFILLLLLSNVLTTFQTEIYIYFHISCSLSLSLLLPLSNSCSSWTGFIYASPNPSRITFVSLLYAFHSFVWYHQEEEYIYLPCSPDWTNEMFRLKSRLHLSSLRFSFTLSQTHFSFADTLLILTFKVPWPKVRMFNGMFPSFFLLHLHRIYKTNLNVSWSVQTNSLSWFCFAPFLLFHYF